LEQIYEIQDLHKGPIVEIIPLNMKVSGLFPNNIYNKEAGSCGMLYFSSFCLIDGLKIWKISYYGGRISESKIKSI
jgi:hypothetical protein